ncbi:ZIP family metal transporter [Fontisphaera persica]|uniref:ZIP family metal transporter n=1 Tax=Fontisphaera persica TaxID=2974023 RepID=UPI0024C0DD06|nr:ZIP family metal transporter [Fontisphaera persica]WCJ60799.1 ZIP family metal transporter [Fontisphaera persica]
MDDVAWPPGVLLVIYCALILLSSLVGGAVPLWIRLTHTRMQLATSFVAGLMLGVGVLHLLPHASFQMGSLDRVMQWMLAGFLVMFFVQRFLHFHHHDVPDEDPEACGSALAEGKPLSLNLSAAPAVPPSACQHHDHHPHQHTLADKSARQLSWGGAALGLTIHTVINGMALAASVRAESNGHFHGGLAGLATFLVIFLHKPFDALTITTLMTAGGWSRAARHFVNVLFALMIPVGVGLFYLGASQVAESHPEYVGAALAFSAGTFLCIAASDLLPELQFHSHDRIKLSLAMLAGLGLAFLIGAFEAGGHDHGHGHDHEHEQDQPAAVQPK